MIFRCSSISIGFPTISLTASISLFRLLVLDNTFQDTSSCLPFFSRHYSHMTKSRIFKNLNLRRKADQHFRGNLLKNHFRNLKLYSNPQVDWPEFVDIWAPIEKQKAKVHSFDRANHLGFATWEYNAQEDLNLQKKIFPLKLRFWYAQKQKIWSIFYEKKII